MKDLSQAAKLRISKDPLERSLKMSELAKKRASKMTKAQHKAHAMMMVRARKKKTISS